MTCMIAIFTALRMSLALASEVSHQWKKRRHVRPRRLRTSGAPCTTIFSWGGGNVIVFSLANTNHYHCIQPQWQEKPIRWRRRVLCWCSRKREKGRKGGAGGGQKKQGKTWGPQLLMHSNDPDWSHPLNRWSLQTSKSFTKCVFVCLLFTHQLEPPSNRFLPINAPGQDSQKPTLAADALKAWIAWKIAWLLKALCRLGDLKANPLRQVQKVIAIKYELVWYL